jgi:hypothetical protein
MIRIQDCATALMQNRNSTAVIIKQSGYFRHAYVIGMK